MNKILTDGRDTFNCRIADELPKIDGCNPDLLDVDQVLEVSYYKDLYDPHYNANFYHVYIVTWIERNTVDRDELLEKGWMELADSYFIAIEADYEKETEKENKLWYAVVTDDDNDWGYGSFDLNEAKQMCRNYDEHYLAVIDDGVDPGCIGLIKREDF